MSTIKLTEFCESCSDAVRPAAVYPFVGPDVPTIEQIQLEADVNGWDIKVRGMGLPMSDSTSWGRRPVCFVVADCHRCGQMWAVWLHDLRSGYTAVA